VTVRAVSGPSGEPPRVAYAVGRAVGSAVARNRWRRRLRAAVNEERSALVPGTAYLVGATPGAADLSFARLRTELREALVRAGRSSS
jgi:ribonuclease P protein component